MEYFNYQVPPPNARNQELLVSVLEAVLRQSRDDTEAVNHICHVLCRWGGRIDRAAIEEERQRRREW